MNDAVKKQMSIIKSSNEIGLQSQKTRKYNKNRNFKNKVDLQFMTTKKVYSSKSANFED